MVKSAQRHIRSMLSDDSLVTFVNNIEIKSCFYLAIKMNNCTLLRAKCLKASSREVLFNIFSIIVTFIAVIVII